MRRPATKSRLMHCNMQRIAPPWAARTAGRNHAGATGTARLALSRLRISALAPCRGEQLGRDRCQGPEQSGPAAGLLRNGPGGRQRARGLRPPLRRARQARVRHRVGRGRRQVAQGCREGRVRKAVRRPAPLPPRRPAEECPQAADRRTDERALRHAAARHGQAHGGTPRGLGHRLGRRQDGPPGGRRLRPRRLYRLPDRVPAVHR